MKATSRITGRKTGAWLIRHALEQLPIRHTFGIPGVHNTEAYDELSRSTRIQPLLVTHECGGAFAADAISRVQGDGGIGCLVIVPAAGVTHAASGIGEAFLAGVPMLVIAGGIRTDVPFGYQLHEIDMHTLLAGMTKGTWRIREHREIVPAIFEAYALATSGRPGPVFVEVPANVMLFQDEVEAALPAAPLITPGPAADGDHIRQAADVLAAAVRPAIFAGWGAVDAGEALAAIAELLGAPVATTLQGMSAFPGNHPLHAGMGFSKAAVPAAENAFQGIDALLAVGTRFAEIPTGSFGVDVPDDLVHIDIDPDVLNRNYPARVAIPADARLALPALLAELRGRNLDARTRRQAVETQIARDKKAYRESWYAHRGKGVNPVRLFDAVRSVLSDDAIVTVDDGNHTFLAAELWEVRAPRTFISPSDFNCMGYAVPAAVGAKLVRPATQVVSFVGDGAFLMTGMELLTAATAGAGVVCFVFSDGELSQISQGQEVPYNRKTCTVLGKYRLDGLAAATGADYVAIPDDVSIAAGVTRALESAATGRPVVVDVAIDYSKRTRFTQGIVKTVAGRFSTREKIRFVGRAVTRKFTG